MNLPEILLGVLGLGCVVAFLITVSTVNAVLAMRRGIRLTPVTDAEYPKEFATLQQHAAWAREHGFESFLGGYVTKQVGVECFVAGWRHQRTPTYFCVYSAAGRVYYDFVTEFSENRSLTTASTKDGHALPHPPGDYTQAFSDSSLDELFTRHAEAEQFLMSAGRIAVRPVPWGFQEAISRSAMLQAAYIQTLPLWQLRGLYWFLVRRRLLHGKTIGQLHASGRLVLPHEPRFKEFEFTA